MGTTEDTVKPARAPKRPATPRAPELPAGWVMPRYDGGGIANIGSTVLSHFGVEAPLPPLAAEALPPALIHGARTIILLVLDALGYEQLRARLAEGTAPRLAERLAHGGATLAPLTSVFPSTTSAALTTLHTGALPARHGMLGFTLYLPDRGAVYNMIFFKPEWQAGPELAPEGFVPEPTLPQRLASAGVASQDVNLSALVGTALSRIFTAGATTWSYVTSADMAVRVRRLAEAADGPTFIFAYWPSVDAIAHRYGPGSDEHRAEVAALDFILDRELLGRLPPDTLLLVTADHGQMTTSRERTILLHEHPALLEHLAAPPAGERRVVYLRVAPEHRAWVRDYFARNFADAAFVLAREEAAALGLYGLDPLPPIARERIGDLIVLGRDDWQLPFLHNVDHRAEPFKHLSIGAHGGLTPAEMLVPLITVRG
jgi:hypothetical protein